MKRLKKQAVGYNTVSSVDGVINARGVKSKPKNMKIFGYTHEIGEGEKSLDTPYELVSLDSGAMSVDGVDYEHSIKITNNDTTIQVPVPIALNSVESVSDYIYKDNELWKLKQLCQVFTSNDYLNLITLNDIKSDGSIVYKLGKSTINSNNQNIAFAKSTRVEVVPRSENRGNICKIFAKGNDVALYLRYSPSTYPQFSSVSTLKEWLTGNPIELVFVSLIATDHILSDYAQNLLNSFTLQNQNRVFVEGYPDLKISGYIQK
ncbi:MAG: hypothetical protein ACI4WH_07750 [Oscillospiraceae bacterium]